MLLLFLLCCFDLFVNFTHNLASQEKVVDLWHIKESKANVGIWSFTRYGNFGINSNMSLFHAPT
jgi:hypothetical protein